MRSTWKLQDLRETQAGVKEKLNEISPDIFSSDRLQYCLDVIGKFTLDQSSSDHLEIYVCVVQALLHHSRIGGLKPPDVTRIHRLALKLLNLYRVMPGTSKVVEFHADLANVMSFVEFSNNRSWLSIWDLNVTRRLRDNPVDENYRIAKALRLHKLGFINEAKSNFEPCLDSSVPSIRRRAYLGLIKCARWLDNLEEVRRLVSAARADQDCLDKESEIELQWETSILDTLDGNKHNSIVDVFSSKSLLYTPIYVLEAFLWSLASEEIDSKSKRPTLVQIQNRRNLRLSNCPDLFEIVQNMETCYQRDIGVEQRISHARNVFELSLQITGIDAEALALVALSRWLQRLQFPEQQAIVLQRIDGLYRDSKTDFGGGIWKRLALAK